MVSGGGDGRKFHFPGLTYDPICVMETSRMQRMDAEALHEYRFHDNNTHNFREGYFEHLDAAFSLKYCVLKL